MNPPMYISYDDDAPPVRSASAQIWRDCARQAAAWTTFFAFLAAVVLVLGAFGLLDWYLPIS